MKDFSLADSLMERCAANPALTNDQKRALFSAWGRIYLQCGDVFGAERKFSEARRIRDSPSSAADLRDLIDKGLIAVAQNDFQTAYGCFESALKLEPASTMVSSERHVEKTCITNLTILATEQYGRMLSVLGQTEGSHSLL